MIKNLLQLTIFFTFVNLYSQTPLENELDSIQTESEVISFIKKNKGKNGKIIIFNTEKHNSGLALDLYNLSIGSKKVYEDEISKTYYKILDKQNVPHHRMSYIMLDKNKISEKKLHNLKFLIKSKYQQGYNFKDLAAQYSMDGGAKRGGDSGWFASGTFYEEVENEIINNQSTSEEITTVQVPSKNFVFLILKDHTSKNIEELKVLKVTEKTR